MAKRKIIRIDEEKCNGCGLCIPNCPEGALKIIDGKARLISDLFCDGLGACIGHCPQGAITIEEREAEKYDERTVMANIVRQGPNVIREHLDHLRSHNEHGYLQEALASLKERGIAIPADKTHHHGHEGCPGSKIIDMHKKAAHGASAHAKAEPQLGNWPVQIKLVPVNAPYFNGAHLLIAADCVPFAYADFHEDLLHGKVLLVGCPKLDDISFYSEKISAILKENDVASVTYAHMEVPCCSGLINVIKEAIAASGRAIPFNDVTITIRGERRQ